MDHKRTWGPGEHDSAGIPTPSQFIEDHAELLRVIQADVKEDGVLDLANMHIVDTLSWCIQFAAHGCGLPYEDLRKWQEKQKAKRMRGDVFVSGKEGEA